MRVWIKGAGFVRLASILLGTALLYQSSLPTHLLRDSVRDFITPWPSSEEYIRERERNYALTIPYDAIRKALLQRLPEEIPVGQDASVTDAAMAEVRVAEQLYPRRPAPARCFFAMKPEAEYRPEMGEELTRSAGRVYFLKGCDPSVAQAASSRDVSDRQSVRFSVWALLLSLLSVLGWGALTRSALRLDQLGVRLPALPVIVLCAAFFLGLLFSVATWLQVPLPILALKVLGAILLLGLTCGRTEWRSPRLSLAWATISDHAGSFSIRKP